jgi:hypothetical protein
MLLVLKQLCFGGGMCVSSTYMIGTFGAKRTISTWKIMICRMDSFQKLILSSQGTNVLDAAPSITEGFVWRRYICFFNIDE